MTYLIAQLWLHLLIALGIGVYLGWMFWGWRRASEAKFDKLEIDALRSAHARELAAARAIVAEHRAGGGADEIAKIREAHAQELRAARSIVAAYRAGGGGSPDIEKLREAHIQELAAARAIMADHRSGGANERTAGASASSDGADEKVDIAALRAAHAQELAAARSIMAAHVDGAADGRVDALETSLAECVATRDALQTENTRLEARLAALEAKLTEVENTPSIPAPAWTTNVVAAQPERAVTTRTAASPTSDTTPMGLAQAIAGELIKPTTYDAPPPGGADDLKQISGVGQKLEDKLHTLGVYTFAQIASWTDAEIGWVDEHLKFRGRIQRDRWIEQAKLLAAGGATAFAKKVDQGGVRS